MPLVTVQELIDAGVHYGHQASRWNPKMKPYIYGKRHKIHIIDLQETIRGLYQACHFLRQLASTGAQILFLGTKRQIRAVVEAESGRCGMPAVTERWIGGTLTNFSTIRERLERLIELEQMESDGALERHKKKAQSMLRREMRKIRRNMEGVRELSGLPGAIVVIDPRREEITVREAARMNVPVICILDTDCDPDKADILIPANDDAMSSVQLVLTKLADAILEGRQSLDEATLAQAQQRAQEDPRSRQVPGRRSEPPGARPARRAAPPGGRLGRQAKGRFADRLGGHADSVSIGTGKEESEEKAAKSQAAPAPAKKPAAEKPATEPPAPEKSETEKAAQPEQAQPEQAQPEQAQPEQAQPEQAQPEPTQSQPTQPESEKPAGEAQPETPSEGEKPADEDKPEGS